MTPIPTLLPHPLVFPRPLPHAVGSCIPHVTSLVDPANLGPLTLYASILWATVWAVVHRDAAVMWGLGFVVVPFLPASNVFFPVGAVMAERVSSLVESASSGARAWGCSIGVGCPMAALGNCTTNLSREGTPIAPALAEI